MARTDTFNNWATDVANSIRSKTGKTDKIPASEFDTEIASIEEKIDPILQDKVIEINQNGTKSITPDDGYDGLGKIDVTVNVENTDDESPKFLYTELEWIETMSELNDDGGTGQYLLTDYKLNNNSRVLLKFSRNVDLPGGSMFGVYQDSGPTIMFAYHTQENHRRRIEVYYGNPSTTKLIGDTGTIKTMSDFVVDLNKNKLSLYDFDNNLIDSNTFTYSEFEMEYTTPIMAARVRTDGVNNNGYSRLYSCKIYDNGTLIYDIVPAKDAEGIVCAYNKVDGTFMYNSGTGSFIGGPIVQDVYDKVTDDEEHIKTDTIYVIKDGIEQTDITGGHTYIQIAGDGLTNYGVIQKEDCYTLTCKRWSRCLWETLNTINFAKYNECKIYFDYSADKYTTTSDSNTYEFGLVLGKKSDGSLVVDKKPIVDGEGVFTRNTYEIDITEYLDELNEEKFGIQTANLTERSNYQDYGVNFYNVWIEGKYIKTGYNLQDKSVEITENGIVNIVADNEYYGLNQVEVITNISTSTQEIGLLIKEYDSNGYPTKVQIVGYDTVPNYLLGSNSPNFKTHASWRSNITEVEIKDATSLGEYCLANCPGLKKVILADSITESSNYPFNGSPIIEVNIPTQMSIIPSYFFGGCTSLKLNKIPDNITRLGNMCFTNTGITQISMKNVTQLGTVNYGAFSNSTKLIAVWIGSAVTSSGLGTVTFSKCTALKKIFIDLPRATVEAINGYSVGFSNSAVTSDVIVCNDDEGFITKAEFDAIDWTTYTE